MQGSKKHYLLVDGYNIINSWEDLKEAQKISLEEARDRLVDMLGELASITGEQIIVVFDSYLQKNAIRQVYQRKGIEIVFTKEYETADNYIERLVSESKKNEFYKVASSDAIIQSITFGKGATRISAQELFYYYSTNKNHSLKRINKNRTKASKNIVSLEGNSLALLEELEKKLQ